MQSSGTRRVQRVHLPQPLVARLGSAQVAVIDISILGARIEHHSPLIAGAESRLVFTWEGEEIAIACRIARSHIERLNSDGEGLTVYHSGLEFDVMNPDTKSKLKDLVGLYISRALEEQKLNARGAIPDHDADKMPIFRFGGQLSADERNVAGSARLPIARVVKQTGYVCYQLERDRWRRKRTFAPDQPPQGFTVSAAEDPAQAALLCEAYLKADRDGRKMIQLFAQLSIIES